MGNRARLSRPASGPASCGATARRALKKIIETELNRTYAFGKYAQNVAGVDGVHADLERLTTAYWPEGRCRNGYPEHRKRARRRHCDAERKTMVSNFERILDEIRKEAHRIAGTYGLEPEAVVKLIMDIVDLEDRNRVKAEARINQRIRGNDRKCHAYPHGSREGA